MVMIQSHQIPVMKLYRIKTYLPTNDKLKTLNSVAILNNPDLDTNLKFIDHPMFLSNSKYLNYYIEPRYIEKIRSKTIRINYKDDRNDIYEKIHNTHRSLRTPINATQIGNRNLYYDISKYNEIFFNNIGDWGILNKIKFYFEYLKARINSPTLHGYTIKTIFMDVNAWTSSDRDKIDNAVSYIFLACKRFPDTLSILGDIDIIFYNDKTCFKFIPATFDKNQFILFKKYITMLSKTINFEKDSDIDITDEESDKSLCIRDFDNLLVGIPQ